MSSRHPTMDGEVDENTNGHLWSSPSTSEGIQQVTQPGHTSTNSPAPPTPSSGTADVSHQALLEPFGPAGKKSTVIKEILGVATLVCCMLVTQSGLSQVIPPLSIIAQTFGVQDNPGKQSWFAAAYSLSVGTIILPAGRLGDMYGHKRLVCIGFIWGAFWALLCGLSSFSKSDIFFDVCRGFQGSAFAILLPNSVAILARATHEGSIKRAIYFTVFAASAPNGFLIGALFTGLIVQFHPQRWDATFYMAAGCMIVLAFLAYWSLPSDRYLSEFHGNGEEDSSVEKDTTAKPTFDWAGTVLAVSGLILFNFAWNQAAVTGWDKAYNPVLLAVGLLLLAGFLYVETKVSHPLIPTDIWTVQNSIILICVSFGWSSFGIWSFYSVRWWVELRGASLLSVVAMALPAGVAGCVAAVLSIVILRKFGPHWVMLFAMTAFTTGSVLIATQPRYQLYWEQTFPSWAIMPGGMDASFPAASLIVASSLPPHRQGVAGSLVNTIINYSVALGLGIAGTVESHTNSGGQDLYSGYRYSLFLGTGLAALGAIIALANVVASLFVTRARDSATSAGEEKEID
ncbi:unnamed protein product [Sympodiomycopsis kandeliae]